MFDDLLDMKEGELPLEFCRTGLFKDFFHLVETDEDFVLSLLIHRNSYLR